MNNKKFISIKTKLLSSYFLLIMIPLFLFAALFYRSFSNIVLKQTYKSADQVFYESKNIIENRFSSLEHAHVMISNNYVIYEALLDSIKDNNVERLLEQDDEISELMNYIRETSQCDNISIFIDNEGFLPNNRLSFYPLYSEYSKPWYRTVYYATSAGSNRVWCFPHNNDTNEDFISIARTIYNTTDFRDRLAIIRMDVKLDRILDILEKGKLTDNSMVMLIHNNTIFIEKTPARTKLPQANIIKRVISYTEDQWHTINLNNEKVIFKHIKITSPDWHYVSIIPYKDIMSDNLILRNQMAIIMAIIIVLIVILAAIFTKSSIRNISKLNHKMKYVAKGNFDVSFDNIGNDEIGQLMVNFSMMTQKLNNLINEKYKIEISVKNAEMKLLQAQINPHFLYNSLELINCIGIENDLKDINEMVYALSQFYKISLSKGNDFIPIAQEINHVRYYIKIQNLRYGDKIGLMTDINEDINDFYILKTVLQPIVENSIIHGILEKSSKRGTVTIRSYLSGSDIVIEVEDDGVGIDKKAMDKIMKFSDASFHGYGLNNTNKRIKLFYGDKYGLSFSTEPGKGTIVNIRIPAHKGPLAPNINKKRDCIL